MLWMTKLSIAIEYDAKLDKHDFAACLVIHSIPPHRSRLPFLAGTLRQMPGHSCLQLAISNELGMRPCFNDMCLRGQRTRSGN